MLFDKLLRTKQKKLVASKFNKTFNFDFIFQIDYFGIASIAYTMLYGGYMKVIKKDDKYEAMGKPKR